MMRTTTDLGPCEVKAETSAHWPQMRPPFHCPLPSPGLTLTLTAAK